MQVLENFVKHYSRKSVNTLDSYTRTIKQYYSFVKKEKQWSDELHIITNTTWSEINLFVNYLIEKDLNPYSINQKLSALKTFFKFCRLQHLINSNPVEEVEKVGTECVEQNSDFLTPNEFKTLMRTIKTPTGGKQDCFSFTSQRDLFMVGLILTTGLRISEVLDLKINQINLDSKTIRVLGKGKKLRTVPVTQEVIMLMNKYLIERKKLKNIVDKEIMFLSRNGKKMSRQNTNVNIKKYCKRAGIEKDIHNHSLRHSSLTAMVESGMSLAKVQAMAGHSDSKTTARYTHTTTENIEEYLPQLF